MAKDKAGHGSEAHKEFHKPQVEHGKYKQGNEFHGLSPGEFYYQKRLHEQAIQMQIDKAKSMKLR
jgi:hypothetical protein